MIYDLINKVGSPLGRRLLTILFLILLLPMAVAAIVGGITFSFVKFITINAKDIWVTVTYELPRVAADYVGTIKTGNTI